MTASKDPPVSFSHLASALHQDAAIIFGETVEELADGCASNVPHIDRKELVKFLDGLLERRDSSELRRILRKQTMIQISMPRESWWTLFGRARDKLKSI